MTDDQFLDKMLDGQIPEYEDAPAKNEDPIEKDPVEVESSKIDGNVIEETEKPKTAADYLNTTIQGPTRNRKMDKEERSRMIAENKLTRIGESIDNNAYYHDGWIDVDKNLLGERAYFYPESWSFRIRPATVEAIRNWSTFNVDNFNSVDDVFNEVLKSCLMIITPEGNLPWGNLNSWDRFFFILLIREYTFAKGEYKIEFTEECPECENEITFTLTSQSLMYDMPDQDVMKFYDRETRTWNIDPQLFEVDADPITFYVPTLEREANIKQWGIAKLQENNKKKFDQAFLRFLPWMIKKLSKDTTISSKQVREQETIFRSWDIDTFSFFDEVLRNITVMPSMSLKMECPICGEEVTAQIRFQDSIKSLFSAPAKRSKFGSK